MKDYKLSELKAICERTKDCYECEACRECGKLSQPPIKWNIEKDKADTQNELMKRIEQEKLTVIL